ncbi:MAG: SpoIIE family protein phosphatase [Thermoanaerobaculia bacterium]
MEVERRPADSVRRTTGGLLAVPERSRIHPLVVFDYRVRVPSMFFVGLIPLSHFYRDPHPLWFWGVMFTDGVSEARSPSGAHYGEERLLTLLCAPPASASALVARIEESQSAHTSGAEPSDDVTLLAIRRAH